MTAIWEAAFRTPQGHRFSPESTQLFPEAFHLDVVNFIRKVLLPEVTFIQSPLLSRPHNVAHDRKLRALFAVNYDMRDHMYWGKWCVTRIPLTWPAVPGSTVHHGAPVARATLI